MLGLTAVGQAPGLGRRRATALGGCRLLRSHGVRGLPPPERACMEVDAQHFAAMSEFFKDNPTGSYRLQPGTGKRAR
eukprot:2899287-Alexandrium_andersonii.AAC.1